MNARFRGWVDDRREDALDAIHAAETDRARAAGWRRLGFWDLVFALHMIVVGQ